MDGDARKYIVITRPASDAAQLACDLDARGFLPFTEPLLEIIGRAVEWPAQTPQAVILTSAHTIPFLPEDLPRNLPIFCVGPATAKAALEAGFHDVTTAGGNARELQALLNARGGFMEGAPVWHPGGVDRAAALEIPGGEVVDIHCYKAEGAKNFSPAFLAALSRGDVDSILFFSPRTGAIFADLAAQHGVAGGLNAIKALCFSAPVVKSLEHLSWAEMRVARRPDMASMCDLLDGADA